MSRFDLADYCYTFIHSHLAAISCCNQARYLVGMEKRYSTGWSGLIAFYFKGGVCNVG